MPVALVAAVAVSLRCIVCVVDIAGHSSDGRWAYSGSGWPWVFRHGNSDWKIGAVHSNGWSATSPVSACRAWRWHWQRRMLLCSAVSDFACLLLPVDWSVITVIFVALRCAIKTEEANQPALWSGVDLASWLLGTCQVGRLVRRPGGPPRQMLKEGVEWGRAPGGP